MFFAPGPSAWGAASKGKVTSPTTAGGKVFYGGDLESGTEALYPGITTSEQGLRWGFIQKVYGILCAQMLMTTCVAATVMFDPAVSSFVWSHPSVGILSLVLPLIGLCPLYMYRQSHPLNLVLLGAWTATLSIGIGLVCAMYPSVVVLQALILTAAITVGLTAYTFYATRNGKEFDFMGPWLFSSLVALVCVSLLALFFPMGSGVQLLLAFFGAVLFSAYIVYDTFEIIKRYSVDEYVWASVGLYLDILNLFLRLLEILGMARND